MKGIKWFSQKRSKSNFNDISTKTQILRVLAVDFFVVNVDDDDGVDVVVVVKAVGGFK